MYCPNCGSKIDDQARFCDICGSKIEEVRTGPNTDQAVEKKEHIYSGRSLMGQMAQMSGGRPLAARILAMVILIALLSTGFSQYEKHNYTKPLDEIMRLMNRRDTDPNHYIQAMLPKQMAAAWNTCDQIASRKIDDYADLKVRMENGLEDNVAEKKLLYGSDFKIRYQIESSERVDASELREGQYAMRNGLRTMLKSIQEGGIYYGEIRDSLSSSELKKFNKATSQLAEYLLDMDVSDGYILEITILVKGKNCYEEENNSKRDNAKRDEWVMLDTDTINVANINGEWCSPDFSYFTDFMP